VSAAAERKTDFKPSDRWLTVALVLGTSGWFLHLNLSYILVPEACVDRTKAMLHLTTIACLLISAVGAAIAWRIRARIVSAPTALPDSDRTRWLSTMILWLSIALMVVIVAQEIPNLMLRSCD
jgi:hypothetical protein